jgi:alpha-beta hydrolase superfamily lysophospholipase
MTASKQKSFIEKITFSSDNFLLKGCLHLPPVSNPPVVIGAHGLFSDKNSPKQIELARGCNRRHIAYFRFDHRGCGQSEAPYKQAISLESRCRDLISAAKMLKMRGDMGSSLGLFGSSLGGAACLAVAHYLEAHAVVTWAAPIRSAAAFKAPVLRADPVTPADLSNPFEKNPFDISDRLQDTTHILIFHGDADETVPLSHAEEIFKLVSRPKKLVVFPRSDHRMSHPSDQQKFIRQASRWFQDYLKQI